MLTHREQPHTHMVLCWQTHSIINDLQVQCIVDPEADTAGIRLGMAGHVGESLLGNTVRSYLNSRRQRRESVWYLDHGLQGVRQGGQQSQPVVRLAPGDE